jgi:hypothetical protein
VEAVFLKGVRIRAGKVDKPTVCGRLLNLKMKMPPPNKKKKLDYLEETEGSRMAARIRQRANKMTSGQREECLKKAMELYYGGQPREAARS